VYRNLQLEASRSSLTFVAVPLPLHYPASTQNREKGENMPTFNRRSVPLRLAALTLLSLLVFSQTNTSADEATSRAADRKAITAVLTAQQDAWNHGDVDKFLIGYWHSPNLTFSGASGISRGWDGVLARYKKTYPNRAAMGQLDFSNLEFRFLGPDAALVLGHWHLQRETGNEKDNANIGGVFSLVWQRFPKGWRIIHDHTSADSPAK
jgi:uncharacterized protein (TIGR02246 family)